MSRTESITGYGLDAHTPDLTMCSGFADDDMVVELLVHAAASLTFVHIMSKVL